MAKKATTASLELKARFPPKLDILFRPSRYKIIYGGRGGGKSWAVARALLLLGTQKPLRILCAREFMASISDSVHKLLSDQIDALGLATFYRVEKATIAGANGTEIRFSGIRTNVSQVKSFEGINICWIEEAANVSKSSWETVIPTIRADGSEIWITLNPELESDETYKRFVLNPPPNAQLVKVNWSDNPWFPHVLREEMDLLRERDPDAWLNIWQGETRHTLDGAIYAKELRTAQEEGRISAVPYDATKPVHCFYDLGWSDHTVIWMAQTVAMQTRVIDHIEGSQRPLDSYLHELQSKPYIYGTDWLPHDARAKQLGSGKSIEELMRAKGRNVRIVPQLSVADGINAVRTVFGNMWFDAERCADGLQALRHYRYEVDVDSKVLDRRPLHDENSHCFDGATSVLTRHGACRIMDLPETGEVLTPCGWKPYRNPRITLRNAQLAAVVFSDGYMVKCTPDHLFLTVNGWISASDLRTGSLIQSTLTRSRATLAAVSTVFGQANGIFRGAAKDFTGMFGIRRLVKSLVDVTSIMATAIRSTMHLPILSAFPVHCTYPTHGGSTNKRKSFPESISPFWRVARRRNGMVLRKGAFGTAEWRCEPSRGKSPSGSQSHASSVGSRFSRWCARLMPDAFALKIAKPLVIERVIAISERADVWDITVPGVECFSLANGAVVHNSADALRYLAIALREPKVKPIEPARPRPQLRAGNSSWMGA